MKAYNDKFLTTSAYYNPTKGITYFKEWLLSQSIKTFRIYVSGLSLLRGDPLTWIFSAFPWREMVAVGLRWNGRIRASTCSYVQTNCYATCGKFSWKKNPAIAECLIRTRQLEATGTGANHGSNRLFLELVITTKYITRTVSIFKSPCTNYFILRKNNKSYNKMIYNYFI